MKLRNALLAATIIAAPVAAMAQPVTGPYISLGAGGNYMQSNPTGFVPSTGKPNLKSQGGPLASLAGGFGFGNGLRVELQGDYRFDATHLNSGYKYGGGSDIQNFGLMANVLYDLPMFNLPVVPYVGAGAGYEYTDFQRTSLYTKGATSSAVFKDKAIGGVAAQGIAGVAYQVPGAPGLAITGEYRFMTIFSAGMHDNGTGTVPNRFKISNQFDHALLVGIRYNFGQAPAAPMAPPPAAVPAVTPARTYLVFFDWDKSDLTPRARQIVAEAATASTRVAVTKIDVSGYTDSSGTAPYNQGLSMRRAATVSAELVRLGVPKGVISIMAFGETHQLVPTANGVREPQNRRVEIVLH